jgi:hypothetical protein
MKAIAVDPSGIDIMAAKGDFLVLKTDPLPFAAANILKQQCFQSAENAPYPGGRHR